MPTNKAKGIGVIHPIYIFTVLYDPNDIFSAGASFGKKDFEESLKNGAWPTDMILKGSDGRRFRVKGTEIEVIGSMLADTLILAHRHLPNARTYLDPLVQKPL